MATLQRHGLVDHRRAAQRLHERRPRGLADGRMVRIEHRDAHRLEQRAHELHVGAAHRGVGAIRPARVVEDAEVRRGPRGRGQFLELPRDVAERLLGHHLAVEALALDGQAAHLLVERHGGPARFGKVGVVGGGPEHRGRRNAGGLLDAIGQGARAQRLEPGVSRTAEEPRLLPRGDHHAASLRHRLEPLVRGAAGIERRRQRRKPVVVGAGAHGLGVGPPGGRSLGARRIPSARRAPFNGGAGQWPASNRLGDDAGGSHRLIN